MCQEVSASRLVPTNKNEEIFFKKFPRRLTLLDKVWDCNEQFLTVADPLLCIDDRRLAFDPVL